MSWDTPLYLILAWTALKMQSIKCDKCNIHNDIVNNFCFSCGFCIKCTKCNITKPNIGHKICKSCYVPIKRVSKGCGHNICVELREKNCFNSAFILPLINYNNKFVGAWLGCENGGQYRGKYNLSGGKADNSSDFVGDNVCFLKAAQREVKEEIKITFQLSDDAPCIIHKPPNSLRGTPVFLARLRDGTSRDPYQKEINRARADSTTPFCEKEMSHITCINISTFESVDNVDISVSEFATIVIKKITPENLKSLGL